jgi:hypothetical protein
MNAPAPKENPPELGGADAKTWTFASEAAAALYNAISASAGSENLADLASMLWRSYGAGAINDDDAAFLQSYIDRRRPIGSSATRNAPGRPVGAFVGRAIERAYGRFMPRRRRVLTDEQKLKARERRRTLGGSAVMPPNLRCHYTEGQRAVLCIIAGEIKHSGNCDLPIDKIAALAGVCRTTVQTTLHEARRLGHIEITERPRPGKKNLTNIVHIMSAEWLTWIKRGPSAHRPTRTGSNPFAEKNLRADETSVSPTKSTYLKYSYGIEQRKGSGPPQSTLRRRA